MAWPGGPADQAGLTAGDIIIAVGDQTLSETRTLQDALSRHSAGETVRLRVLNSEGNTVSMRVRLGGS
jgi:S1-C subfamily serine protease